MIYLFLQGGITSEQLAMDTFQEFSQATGLKVNPRNENYIVEV